MSEGFDWIYIKETIDMDQWKHSWHLPEDYEERRNVCIDVLNGKLATRLNDIERIRKALAMLNGR